MEPDFWAELEFVEGRAKPDGWRPDFIIPPVEDRGWCIWPITDPMQNPVAFQALDRELYETTTSKLCRPGVQFRLQEGWHIVAHGTIISLHEPQ